MTTFRWYLLGLLALFAGYVAVEYYRPKPLDWTPTYRSPDKIPYGTYVLYELLPEVLAPVQAVRIPIYNQLKLSTPAHTNYVFVQGSFSVSPGETRALLRYVARGNDVFIAADNFEDHLQDTLGFRTDLVRSRPRFPRPGKAPADSVALHLLNLPLARAAGRRFVFPAEAAAYRLLPDSSAAAQITTLAADAQGRAVLVRIRHGRGSFYLSSVPLAFTNYFVLQPRTSNFAFAALSYLAPRPVWWDEYQKQGRVGEQTLVRVLLAHEALRTAFYLACLGAGLFLLFEVKRRQRVIPVVKPLSNTSLLFTRTVAALYQQNGNHALIAEKKINLFLESLRLRLHEPGLDLNDEAARERIAQKAGLSRSRVDELVRLINFVRTAPQVRDAELQQLHQALSDFRKLAFS
jgi:hypothetical protein